VKKKIEIEGIEYVLKTPTFGEDLEALEKAASFDLSGDIPNMQLNAGTAAISSLISSLESWTFRGMTEEGALLTTGDILPINFDTVKSLPSSHGHTLSRLSKTLTDTVKFVEKNL